MMSYIHQPNKVRSGSMRDIVLTQRTNLALIACNVVGATLYVLAASRGWTIAAEREQGIHSVTGEPVIWFFSIIPIIIVFFALNAAWGSLILSRRQWQSRKWWLLTALIWLIAICIDFKHH